jgi:hypothetical protein
MGIRRDLVRLQSARAAEPEAAGAAAEAAGISELSDGVAQRMKDLVQAVKVHPRGPAAARAAGGGVVCELLF